MFEDNEFYDLLIMFPIIEILLGLFIWMALPQLLLQKKKRKPYKRFITVACKVLGIVMIVYGVLNLVKHFLPSSFI